MSAEQRDNRRERRRSPGPGPFDPGPEFQYDPARVREPEPVELGADEVGPGPFDPGPEVGYDPGRGRDPEAEVVIEDTEPPPEIVPLVEDVEDDEDVENTEADAAEAKPTEAEAAEAERGNPTAEVEPGPVVVPEPQPPRVPEPEPPLEPEPQPPSEPEPEPPLDPVDTLDPAPWVPATPSPRRRPGAVQRQSGRRRRSARLTRPGAIVALAALGLLATGVAWAAGLDLLAPLDRGDDGRRVAAAGLGGTSASERQVRDEDPSSLAITSEAGPYHPVASNRKVDYGEAGAKFGASRGGRAHEGQDMFAKQGAPLVAVRDGVVVERGNDGGRGNYIGIHSPEADETYVYLHMVKPTWLKRGDKVAAGTQVGGMGCTGSCFGTHLHFEIRRGDDIENKAIDPLPMLKRWPQIKPPE